MLSTRLVYDRVRHRMLRSRLIINWSRHGRHAPPNSRLFNSGVRSIIAILPRRLLPLVMLFPVTIFIYRSGLILISYNTLFRVEGRLWIISTG